MEFGSRFSSKLETDRNTETEILFDTFATIMYLYVSLVGYS